jgi:hypothetical protein
MGTLDQQGEVRKLGEVDWTENRLDQLRSITSRAALAASLWVAWLWGQALAQNKPNTSSPWQTSVARPADNVWIWMPIQWSMTSHPFQNYGLWYTGLGANQPKVPQVASWNATVWTPNALQQKLAIEWGMLDKSSPFVSLIYTIALAKAAGFEIKLTQWSTVKQYLATVWIQVWENGLLKFSAAHLQRLEKFWVEDVAWTEYHKWLTQQAWGVEYSQFNVSQLVNELKVWVTIHNAKWQTFTPYEIAAWNGSTYSIQDGFTWWQLIRTYGEAVFKLSETLKMTTMGWWEVGKTNPMLWFDAKEIDRIVWGLRLDLRMTDYVWLFAWWEMNGNRGYRYEWGVKFWYAGSTLDFSAWRSDQWLNWIAPATFLRAWASIPFSFWDKGFVFWNGTDVWLPSLYTTSTNGLNVNSLWSVWRVGDIDIKVWDKVQKITQLNGAPIASDFTYDLAWGDGYFINMESLVGDDTTPKSQIKIKIVWNPISNKGAAPLNFFRSDNFEVLANGTEFLAGAWVWLSWNPGDDFTFVQFQYIAIDKNGKQSPVKTVKILNFKY